jgi:hypothetical protein
MADQDTKPQPPTPPTSAPAAMTQKPSPGRIVIFREAGQADCPAIVCNVHSPERVDLMIFSMAFGAQRRTDVMLDQGQGASKMWLWPPRV